MFKRILIANRGEIAVRIIRSCMEMGIETIAIYSEGDKDSLHTLIADKSICIGPDDVSKSYLDIEKIIYVAKILKADAIHPGYGLLAENHCFAMRCREEGIVFIGPSENNIHLFEDKNKAKKFAKSINIPIIEGSDELDDLFNAKEEAKKIGYPVLVKLLNGGGGKGIRIIKSEDEFDSKYMLCFQEGKLLGNPKLYLEKYIKNARHVEVQILRDRFGNTICLGERDCTLQRRYQKVMEESPAVILSDQLRQKIYKDAIKIANKSGYVNAGTIEFLIDENKDYYFIEVNPRIQVEHTVTEMLYDIDIVKEQINIALGEKIPFQNETLYKRGHVIECRINAEIPLKHFTPSIGTVEKLHFPGGVGIRIDSLLYQGYKIRSNFDANIAKLIVKENNRRDAIKKMRRALSEFVISGVSTNIGFLQQLLTLEAVLNNEYNTNFIEEYISEEDIFG